MNLMERLWRWARFRLRGLSLALGFSTRSITFQCCLAMFGHLEGFDAHQKWNHFTSRWLEVDVVRIDLWHLQPLGVQSELGSNIFNTDLSLKSMLDVYEEAISSLRNQAEKATESLLKNGTLDKKSQTKDPESLGVDRLLEYYTCTNMARCSGLRQRWIYNDYGGWCEKKTATASTTQGVALGCGGTLENIECCPILHWLFLHIPKNPDPSLE